MIFGKCNVGEIASRQCEVSKFYVGKAGIGKMGEYVISLLSPNIIISYFTHAIKINHILIYIDTPRKVCENKLYSSMKYDNTTLALRISSSRNFS